MSSGAFRSFSVSIWLTCLTADRMGRDVHLLILNEMNASRSLGRHMPPNAWPPWVPQSFRSSRSPRARRGMTLLTSSDSTPRTLHAWSISLKKLILAALNKLAAYLIISEVSRLHRTMGDSKEE